MAAPKSELVLSPDHEARLRVFERGGRVILADDAITGALVAAGLIITLPAGSPGFVGASLTTAGRARLDAPASRSANPCSEGHEGSTWILSDARGIPCGRVCDRCEGWKRSKYRPEIFEDASYEADEPIEADQ